MLILVEKEPRNWILYTLKSFLQHFVALEGRGSISMLCSNSTMTLGTSILSARIRLGSGSIST